MPTPVGTRVGAMVSATDTEVRMFGYGIYEGNEIPPSDVQGRSVPMTYPNPKIKLDSGEVVWGCECWWGSEETIKAKVGDRNVILVTPVEYRAKNVAD